jgi:hypothetical protein
MASTSSPYGFVPISHQTGTPRTSRMPDAIVSGLAANIFKYQPIKLVSGYIEPVTATTDQIFGIFAGVEYTPTGGRPAVSPFWANGTVYTTVDWMNVYYWPAWDATLRFQVQADGAVAQALMGSQFNIANPTAGSTATGLSAANVLHAGVAGSSQGQFFLEEFFTGVNDPVNGNDAYTDLIVGIAYQQVGPGYQTSIG